VDEVSVLDGGGGDFEHSHYCVAAVLVCLRRSAEWTSSRTECAGVGTSVYYPKAVPHELL
jgi:hypothetical protein